MKKCKLRINKNQYDTIIQHLFPGDGDEHGAVLLAGQHYIDGQLILLVREVHLARENIDYVEGKIGHRALRPQFIHKLITRARDERLVYLAIHNHASDLSVAFSRVDFDSHQRGYPALLQIASGIPVGALVFGKRSIEADVWMPSGERLELEVATVVGSTLYHLKPSISKLDRTASETYDRQVRMFGEYGQTILSNITIGIIGLGGVGSLVAEYLARLGVRKFYLIDDDCIEESNRSRIVSSSLHDVANKELKVNIARKNILTANNNATVHAIVDDVAKESVAKELTKCDYIFLAADSMRARLVFNAIVHQYLIPGVQLGSKIRTNSGFLEDVMSANRPVRPGSGCLWCNQLIDVTQLAKEAKTDDERKAQAYGVEQPNPSVISLNAVCAAHGVNDFLMDYLSLRDGEDSVHYEHFHFLSRARKLVIPRKDHDCSECSSSGLRYARGNAVELPCNES